MNKVSYILKRIVNMDYKSFFVAIDDMSKKSGKSKLFLFCDVIHCGIKFGSGYKDYKLYNFYDLNDEQRSTYVTRTNNNQIVRKLNNPEYYHVVDDKIEFNEYFNEYLHRDWLDLRKASFEEFEEFCNKHEDMMIKPIDETGGHGVEKLYVKDYPSLKDMHDEIMNKKAYLIEEVIRQHPQVSYLYPYSINTYRINTILTDDNVDVLYACIRIGNNGAVIDNHHAGGMSTPIDLETGKIMYPAIDLDNNIFPEHPMTHVSFEGYQLPCFPEALELVKEAAKKIPQLRYIGWDVAISENGPVLIEGNHIPGYDLMQLPGQNPSKMGLLPLYRKYVDGI